MATLPSPRTAPRYILLEPVRPDDRPQGLVENGEPVERSLLADDERRVDADGRRIGHGGETAPETLLVERLRHVLAEGLLGAAVLHELDAEHQTAAAHLAHAPVFLLERLQACEHDRAHALGILDEGLLENDLHRGQPRRRRKRI